MRGRVHRRGTALTWVLLAAGCPRDPAIVDASTSTTTTTTATTGPDAPTSSSTSTTSTSTSTPASSSTTDPDTSTDPDTLPPAPVLVSPADGATGVPLVTSLCWDPVTDPDGEPLRYRVFVDDTELTDGILDTDIGYAGPCAGPLDLVPEKTYRWSVLAFEVDDPSRQSPASPTWQFSTLFEDAVKTVYAEDFNSDDGGWQIGGDAASGAWVHGKPIRALHTDALSQPGSCLGGAGCFFTGQNPGGITDKADVAGGTTTLTSPAFDLGGAAAATIQLGRFFYKSDAGPGPRLAVDLLVPREDDPGEYDAHPLELLSAPTTQHADNLWLPREFTTCDTKHLVDGARLRFSATDLGAGILEAAVDSIKVRAHSDDTVCGAAEGSACDPDLGAMACPADLLCCSQGVLNEGIYRCTPPVAGLDFESPPPTPDSPGNGPLGCDAPDLIVDAAWIDPIFHTIEVTGETCELYEGCLGSTGAREVMLFTAASPNIGSTDLVMGIPANHPELYHYSACHDHYHFDEFARYQLLLGDEVAAVGHKQAFCMLDTVSWAWPNQLQKFDCANQGISRGFSDWYEAGLPCQWVDVTEVPPGDYTLRITLNRPRPDTALPVLNERDYTNNSLDVVVTVP